MKDAEKPIFKMCFNRLKFGLDYITNSISNFIVRIFNLNEVYEKKKEEVDRIGVKKQPSVETGLEELKQLYQEEEDRRSSVESKSAGLLAVNAILLSIFRWQMNVFSIRLVKISAISLLFLSVVLCLITLLPFPYRTPIMTDQSQVLIQKKNEYHIAEMYKEYFATIQSNKTITDKRYFISILAFFLTGIAILLLSIPLLITTI